MRNLVPNSIDDAYIDLAMFEAQFQIVVDRVVRDFAEQGKVRNTDLLFLRRLEHGLLHLRLARALSPVAHIGGCLGATETSTLLLSSANRTSRVSLERIIGQYHSIDGLENGTVEGLTILLLTSPPRRQRYDRVLY